MKDINMKEGKIYPSIISYVIPLILANLLQVFYNTADSVVLANFAEKSAFSSVGATTVIISFLVAVFTNLGGGAEVVIARYLGANDAQSTEKAIHTAALFAFLLGCVLVAVGQAAALPMLRLTQCPEELVGGASLYLRIYLLGVPALMYYSFTSPVLRTRGDTKRPLIYLAVSGGVNVILNIVFVCVCGWSIAGVAIATIVSQYLSAVLITIRLVSLNDFCRLQFRKLAIHKTQLSRIVKYGFPSTVTGLAYTISNLQIQSAVNAYGQAGISGNSASCQIEGFVNAFYFTLGVATLSFLGQNIGAGNRERVFKLLRAAYVLGAVMSISVSGIVLLLKDPLLSVFLPDNEEAMAFATVRAFCVIGATFIGTFNNISTAAVQSFGYMKISMIFSLVGICGFRVLWMSFVYPHIMTPWGLNISYPISWTLLGIGLFVLLRWILKRYKAGAEYKI